jgi:hypothetical protein
MAMRKLRRSCTALPAPPKHEGGTIDSVGARVQGLTLGDQTLALARLAESRFGGSFTTKVLDELFAELRLPPPNRTRDVLSALKTKGLVRNGDATGTWLVTPKGRDASEATVSGVDLAVLIAETESSGSRLGGVAHSVILPEWGAPPALLLVLRQFLAKHAFERNVFGMTRFPSAKDEASAPDPVKRALEAAREVCEAHGLQLHLASDRQLHDDLWFNVAAHMWACKYGIALFEDLAKPKKGINLNLTIEVGSMLMAGRRCALLKDTSIEQLPTDLVGQIYKPVDFADHAAVSDALHGWVREDLGLGSCSSCDT